VFVKAPQMHQEINQSNAQPPKYKNKVTEREGVSISAMGDENEMGDDDDRE